MSHRDEYLEQMKLQLDGLNASMERLEANAHAAHERARATQKDEMDKLRLQSRLAIAKLSELGAADENSWDRLVAETETLRDAFIHSFRRFKSKV